MPKALSCYLQWIFQASEDVPLIDLPEQTSLQGTAKNYLLAGGRIGEAYGRMKIASGINNAIEINLIFSPYLDDFFTVSR